MIAKSPFKSPQKNPPLATSSKINHNITSSYPVHYTGLVSSSVRTLIALFGWAMNFRPNCLKCGKCFLHEQNEQKSFQKLKKIEEEYITAAY